MTEEVSPAVRRRLRKLVELANRGERGEKENAQRMLATLLTRHGLTMEDLERPERKHYRFNCRDAVAHTLLIQVTFRVLNRKDFPIWRVGSHGRELELTAMEFAEIHFLWDLYRRQWSKEHDLLLSAFIQRHKLFGAPTNDGAGEGLDQAALQRLIRMMRTLEQVHEHKPLEHKK